VQKRVIKVLIVGLLVALFFVLTLWDQGDRPAPVFESDCIRQCSEAGKHAQPVLAQPASGKELSPRFYCYCR
jgi:hypothetical protein